MDATQLEQVLDKLIRDVEASVHAFYRGDVRQHTQRIKTDTFRNTARDELLPHVADTDTGAAPGTGDAPPVASELSPEDLVAATRCVMAWLPMGAPTTAVPESRCVSAAREMIPTWGERERARLALKRLQR